MKESYKQTKNNRFLLYFILLLAVPVIWGYGFLVTTDAIKSGCGSFTIVGLRFFLAGCVLICIRLFLKKSKLYQKVSMRDVSAGVVVGVVNFMGFYLQTVGLHYTDEAKSALVTTAYVVLVPIALCLMQKKFRWRSVLYALIFFVGMFVMTDLDGAEERFNFGDGVTFIAMLFFALQIILVDKARVNAVNFTAFQMLTMGGIGLIGALLFERTTFSSIRIEDAVFPILYLGLLSSCYAYIVQAFVQDKISPSLTAIVFSMESLMSVLFSVAFHRKEPTTALFVGCAIMVGAMFLSTLTDQTQTKKRPLDKEEEALKEGFFASVLTAFDLKRKDKQ